MTDGRDRGSTQRVRVLGQRGESGFLVDAGRDDAWAARDVQLARVYDRQQRRLFERAPCDSILARGYWHDVDVPDELLGRVRAEIAELL